MDEDCRMEGEARRQLGARMDATAAILQAVGAGGMEGLGGRSICAYMRRVCSGDVVLDAGLRTRSLYKAGSTLG